MNETKKSDGVYIYSIVADSSIPIQSICSLDLLFVCKNNKFEWLQMNDTLRFCIPRTKDNGELFDNIDDFLSNPPRDVELKLDYKYKIIEHKSKYNIGEFYKNIYRPVVSYKLQRFHTAKEGIPFSNSYDDISIWEYRKEYLSHIRQLELIFDELKLVFRVIEPTEDNKKSYGNILRNIIILSCTEIDSMMKKILKENGYVPKDDKYTTNHYFKLKDALRLGEYELEFKEFEDLGSFNPFLIWKSDRPTQSLLWYDDYNKIKHDRESNINRANMENALSSIASYAILLLAQYGADNTIWKEHMHRFFSIKKRPQWNLEDFYIPYIEKLVPINYPF